MQKIMMPTEETKNFLEVFELFVIAQSAKGVADVTLRNYRYHIKNIGNYMDLNRPFDFITKRDIETMVATMRNSGMAHNSIATYMRMLKTFCREMLLPVVACCVVVSVVGSGFVVVFLGMRKAAQQTPDGFPKGETPHRICNDRL